LAPFVLSRRRDGPPPYQSRTTTVAFVAEVATGGAQDRGAERVDHFAGMQVAGLAEGGGDIEFRVSAIMKFPRLEGFAIT
jgi:hypothetical protein